MGPEDATGRSDRHARAVPHCRAATAGMTDTTDRIMIARIVGCLVAALALTSAPCAKAQAPRPWLVPELLAAAKSEGSTLTIYASMNEEEALPYWAIFEQATGIKVNFVRM